MSQVNHTLRTFRRRCLAGLSIAAAVAVIAAMAVTSPVTASGPAPGTSSPPTILGTSHPDAIADSYIVILEDTEAASAQELIGQLATRYSVAVEHAYRHALRGFAGRMSEATARRLAAEPGVAYVEQNATVRVIAAQQPVPSWGVNRVDQRNLPLDNTYSIQVFAKPVRAYVIDTGIRTTHQEFGARAKWGVNTVGDGIDTDCHGHGTHVAGTIGGKQYGVAKRIRLTAVKVLNCFGSGTFAGVAAGVDWVTGDHAAGAPAVANMSLGAIGTNVTLEDAVRQSIADGIVYTLASGNNNGDACNFTPARVAEAITVNASTQTDARASFSNWGSCTDIFAPGAGITSAWNTSDTATAVLDGTSMAAPHVAGGAALILAANPGLSPAQVAADMFINATHNVINNPGNFSPNRLLFTLRGVHTLSRWHWPGVDHLTTTGIIGTIPPNPRHQVEGTLGMIHTNQVPGTQPIYLCQASGNLFSGDTFTSRNPSCEGRIFIAQLGYVYTAPPVAPHRPLYRCLTSSGEHFDSNSGTCDGHLVEGLLGYTLN